MHYQLFSPQTLTRRSWLGITSASTALGLLAGPPAYATPQQTPEKQLIVHGTTPMNAEPALHHLVEAWETPVKHFYVRSHAPVPKVDLNTFRLKVEGLVENKLSLSIPDMLRRFPQTEVTATMTCAGNRRSEHSLVKKVGGVQWAAG
ncbi:MAG TPA: hypothetical protein DCE55_19010, partial [Planctomycetaceae bacterium]|nr:hypothetical protein [Planctomycetaceae bacterium]